MEVEIVAGCDFGAAKTAGQQTKKTIYIEARRLGERHYQIVAYGRNARLTRESKSSMTWQEKRQGWTIPELRKSLCTGQMPTVVACDFPFSIPMSLLSNRAFASPFRPDGFAGRQDWVESLTACLMWLEGTAAKSPVYRGIETFIPWRKHMFWQRRPTDLFCNAQPPLKDKYQNVFAMTLAGNVFLRELELSGYTLNLLGEPYQQGKHYAIEAYPRAAAAAAGLVGSYKKNPHACLAAVTRFFLELNIIFDMDKDFKTFCTTYESSEGDHDGMDALLCLTTAICYREGQYTLGIGTDPKERLHMQDEGVIVIPSRKSQEGKT